MCWRFASRIPFSLTGTKQSVVRQACCLNTSKVHLSLCRGLWSSLITQRRTEEGQTKGVHTQGTYYSGAEVINKATTIEMPVISRDQVLTSVACGSTVSCSITGAAEAVPRLFTSTSMFTMVWHTPAEDVARRNISKTQFS